jgi:hypothetical protein
MTRECGKSMKGKPMKMNVMVRWLMLLGVAVVLAGCQSPGEYSQFSAAVSPDFPPAPATPINDPQLSQMQFSR